MRIDLSGRVAVVTGGARGIGSQTVRALAESGAKVVVWDRDPAGAALAQELGGVFAEVDVADRPAVDEAVARTLDACGSIDVLVNNAGIVRDAQLVKVVDRQVVGGMSESDFDAVWSVNVKGVFHCTQAVVPHMIERGFGRVINVSSIVGVYGNFGQTNYAASKFAVIGMTKVWARELAKYGITVNVVAPGFVDTEMARGVPEKLLQELIRRTPIGRLGVPAEVAAVYVFLAAEASGFVNGAVLGVDGGMVLGT